jgi:acetyltransferase
LNASFARDMPLPGKMAFISQSGAILTAILDFSLKERIGFSHFVSVGSMLEVDFGDLIDYLGSDPGVTGIVLYIENLTNTRKFMSAARSVSRVKPIVVLKSGRSAAGARAAASHTGALAGEDAVYDAAFQRAGLVRVNTFQELFDCAELLAKQPRPRGANLAIITNAGGPGVMAADTLEGFSLAPALLSPETLKKLNDVLPPFWSRGNPIDILGDATPERYRKVVEICLADPDISGLLIMLAPQALTEAGLAAEAIVQGLKARPFPVFTVWMGGKEVEKGREIFNLAGIPTYETPEQAIRAFLYVHTYSRNLALLQEIPPRLPSILEFDRVRARRIIEENLKGGYPALTEIESKTLLSAYGIPINRTEVASTPEEAIALAKELGYPVALKILSREITHKSDADGVQLNLLHEEDLRIAFDRIMAGARSYDPEAGILGVTVQPMLKRTDYELILGAKKDPDFGPVILFGMGGILTEVLKDHAVALPPLNRLLARRLIESTRVYQLLKGYRNRPPANLILLESILIRLSQLVIDFPEIQELDINPLLMLEDRALAVDVRVMLKPTRVLAPKHLVISPYPYQYEKQMVTKAGIPVFIRPIKPEDAPLMVELFNCLSAQTIYFRFFRPLKALSRDLLVRFTQIDYDREIALVAIEETEGEEKMLAVARLISDPDGREAEFAVLVGDPWQGKGVGAALMERLLSIARERGMISVWGIALAENKGMLSLAGKMGFDIKKCPGAPEYELRANLKSLKG